MTTPSVTSNTLDTLITLVAPELEQVNFSLQKTLESDVELITQIGTHIISSGGKRIRPLLVLLISKALNLQGPKSIFTANIIELIHTATLLHDDVVDESQLRRGKPCANITFGNAASVLTGDFLYSRAFELMCHIGDLKVMEVLAQASNKIAEGEVHQLQNCHNPDISEKIYFEVIYAKTAKLFEAACHVPGVLAGANQNIINSLINFGKYLGTAFQIMDDIIDYSSCHETSGKNMGDDLAEGKTTLPLIIALEHSKKNNLADYQLLRHAIKTGDLSKLEKITDILNKTNALDSTKTIAKKEADKAEKNIGLFIQNPTLLEPLQALCKMTWDRIA